MKKILTLSILTLVFSVMNTANAIAMIPVVSVIAPADGAGVDNPTLPPADGSGVDNSTTPPADGSGVDNSTTPPADGSGVDNSTTPPADGSGVDNSTTPPADGSGVDSSTTPPADGSGVDTKISTSTPSTPPAVVTSAGGGSSSGSYYSGFFGTQAGSVLGAAIDTDNSTTTCDLFKTFMRKGYKNDKTEVVKLQKFLNTQLGTKLPLTGYFGSLTEKAVRSFQVRNTTAILAPWVDAGLMKKAVSTGYFFKTTQHEANKMICPGTVVTDPILN